MIPNEPLRALVRKHRIYPAICWRCKSRTSGWNAGQDDGTDPHRIGYQCCRCGAIDTLTRGHVMRRIRDKARP